MRRSTVVLGLLGTVLDASPRARWERWRPTVDLCRRDDFLVDRLELLHPPQSLALAETVAADIHSVSPETRVHAHALRFTDPWDFESVFATLLDFAHRYPFRPDHEDYLVHITTGTHVQQICLFLLTEARYFPGKLLQTSPPSKARRGEPGDLRVIDLDLTSYRQVAERVQAARAEGQSFLKAGIATRNPAFNALVEQIERVAAATRSPILLTGPTGAGKTHLARKIFELKQARHQIAGRLVELNCATLRGDAAMSAMFGHTRGAFTGAVRERAGALKSADGGLLFLDEIGELGLDEQAMLLRALEDRTFLPLGSDRELHSDFQLIAGTNRDLRACVRAGQFREDLLARVDLWTFRMPALRERPEDIEPNLDHELERHAQRHGRRVSFGRPARAAFLKFATGPEARWPGNFRDFAAAVERMATLASGATIGLADVDAELQRLRTAWSEGQVDDDSEVLRRHLGPAQIAALDRFDRVQLADVLRVCSESRSLSDAGRVLFAASRERRSAHNDADRLRKYLQKFELHWTDLQEPRP